ncbi:hypothetical protein BC834DRAFT_971941 [Gloeopeniophorella convolvens]|nr:hypothetical protein BC834DRAFT_971941 [Gloeopeniophorella convolvens]
MVSARPFCIPLRIGAFITLGLQFLASALVAILFSIEISTGENSWHRMKGTSLAAAILNLFLSLSLPIGAIGIARRSTYAVTSFALWLICAIPIQIVMSTLLLVVFFATSRKESVNQCMLDLTATPDECNRELNVGTVLVVINATLVLCAGIASALLVRNYGAKLAKEDGLTEKAPLPSSRPQLSIRLAHARRQTIRDDHVYVGLPGDAPEDGPVYSRGFDCETIHSEDSVYSPTLYEEPINPFSPTYPHHLYLA